MANRSDNFNRSYSATTLGTPSDGGAAWSAISGVWGVSENKAYLANGASLAVAVLESSATDVDVQLTVSNLSGGQDIGVIARASDDNNYILGVVGGDVWRIYKKVSGGYTSLGSASGTPANGDVVVLSVSGTSVALKINGETKVTGTVSELAANTKHGIYSNSYTPNSFDDFSITDTGGGGGGTPSLVVSDGSHAHAADNLALTIIGTLSIADATHAHAADSITITATSNGTITIPAVRDWGTKVLKTGQTGVQVDIRNITTGALVVRKTGQTTHATTGVCVVTDAAIVAGTTYEVVTRFADGSRGMWDYTAS